MTDRPLNKLTAGDALAEMAAGNITSEELTRVCLNHIEKREPTIEAWVYLDPEYALEQARSRDRERQLGAARGALHALALCTTADLERRTAEAASGNCLR